MKDNEHHARFGVRNLVKHFPITSRGVLFSKEVGVVHAVDGVSFSVNKGETFV